MNFYEKKDFNLEKSHFAEFMQQTPRRFPGELEVNSNETIQLEFSTTLN